MTGKKNMRPAILVLAAAALAALAAGCGGRADAGAPDPAQPQLVDKGGRWLLKTNAAVRLEAVRETLLPGVLETTGQVVFDDKKVKTITARVQGRIEDVRVSLWDTVEKGQPIVELYSPDFMLAEEEYLQAKANAGLGGAFTDVSRMMFDAAKRKLLLLGMQDSDIAAISSPTTTVWMRAPTNGTVFQNQAVIGANVNVGDALYQLGSIDRVWITADIYEVDLARVKTGQRLEAVTETFPDEVFQGEISRISPVIDPSAHTAQIKCEVDNPGLKLKPQMLAKVKIVTRPGSALVVPQQALVYDGDGYYAFVEAEPGLFLRTKVGVSTWNDKGVARVVSGLKAGQRVGAESLALNALWHQTRGESY